MLFAETVIVVCQIHEHSQYLEPRNMRTVYLVTHLPRGDPSSTSEVTQEVCPGRNVRYGEVDGDDVLVDDDHRELPAVARARVDTKYVLVPVSHVDLHALASEVRPVSTETSQQYHCQHHAPSQSFPASLLSTYPLKSQNASPIGPFSSTVPQYVALSTPSRP